MNILLWTLQIILAALSLAGGAVNVLFYDRIAGPPHLDSGAALPHAAWVAIGTFEILCALGLLLPAVTRRWRPAAPIAATCLAVEALLLAGLHALYAEMGSAAVSVILAALAAFVAYGRRVRGRA